MSVGEISYPGNQESEKCLIGEMSVEEMSVGEMCDPRVHFHKKCSYFLFKLILNFHNTLPQIIHLKCIS